MLSVEEKQQRYETGKKPKPIKYVDDSGNVQEVVMSYEETIKMFLKELTNYSYKHLPKVENYCNRDDYFQELLIKSHNAFVTYNASKGLFIIHLRFCLSNITKTLKHKSIQAFYGRERVVSIYGDGNQTPEDVLDSINFNQRRHSEIKEEEIQLLPVEGYCNLEQESKIYNVKDDISIWEHDEVKSGKLPLTDLNEFIRSYYTEEEKLIFDIIASGHSYKDLKRFLQNKLTNKVEFFEDVETGKVHRLFDFRYKKIFYTNVDKDTIKLRNGTIVKKSTLKPYLSSYIKNAISAFTEDNIDQFYRNFVNKRNKILNRTEVKQKRDNNDGQRKMVEFMRNHSPMNNSEFFQTVLEKHKDIFSTSKLGFYIFDNRNGARIGIANIRTVKDAQVVRIYYREPNQKRIYVNLPLDEVETYIDNFLEKFPRKVSRSRRKSTPRIRSEFSSKQENGLDIVTVKLPQVTLIRKSQTSVFKGMLSEVEEVLETLGVQHRSIVSDVPDDVDFKANPDTRKEVIDLLFYLTSFVHNTWSKEEIEETIKATVTKNQLRGYYDLTPVVYERDENRGY